LPHNKVRVVIPHVGGAFGGKAGIHLEPLLACLSRKAGGRPVKFQATREEEFSLLPCRSALTYKIKTGVGADGRITAQKLLMYWDSGAYADYAVNVTRASAYSAGGPYDIPNAWVDAYTIYTNKPWARPTADSPCRVLLGSTAHGARRRGHRDGPLEFRKKNLLKPGSTTLTGERINEHTGNPLKCLEAAASAINYGRLTLRSRSARRALAAVSARDRDSPQGPAMPSFTSTAAVIKMNSDGSVVVNMLSPRSARARRPSSHKWRPTVCASRSAA